MPFGFQLSVCKTVLRSCGIKNKGRVMTKSGKATIAIWGGICGMAVVAGLVSLSLIGDSEGQRPQQPPLTANAAPARPVNKAPAPSINKPEPALDMMTIAFDGYPTK